MGGIVAIKWSSDLMGGGSQLGKWPCSLYNVKPGEGGADRPCSQFQNVFAQISNYFLQIAKCPKKYLSKLQYMYYPSPSLQSKGSNNHWVENLLKPGVAKIFQKRSV